MGSASRGADRGGSVSFFVTGTPRPKGSVDSFGRGAKKRYRQQNAHLLEPWQNTIAWSAKAARVQLTSGPVRLHCEFVFQRPKSHFVNGDCIRLRLRPSAPQDHLQTPDGDKLLRSVMDALTGIAWPDDKRVVDSRALKRWSRPGEAPGVRIEIEALHEGRV